MLLTEASKNLFARPRDEHFADFPALMDRCKLTRHNGVESLLDAKDIRFVDADDGALGARRLRGRHSASAQAKGGRRPCVHHPAGGGRADDAQARKQENIGDDATTAGCSRPRTGRARPCTSRLPRTALREDEKRKKVPGPPSPHRLRDTIATAAFESGCDPLSVKLLMNHIVGNGQRRRDLGVSAPEPGPPQGAGGEGCGVPRGEDGLTGHGPGLLRLRPGRLVVLAGIDEHNIRATFET